MRKEGYENEKAPTILWITHHALFNFEREAAFEDSDF